MILLLSALGAFFAVQVIKAIWPKTIPPLGKMVLVLAAVIGLCLIWLPKHHTFSELVVYSLAAAGLSIFIHRLYRLTRLAGDLVVKRMFQMRRSG